MLSGAVIEEAEGYITSWYGGCQTRDAGAVMDRCAKQYRGNDSSMIAARMNDRCYSGGGFRDRHCVRTAIIGG